MQRLFIYAVLLATALGLSVLAGQDAAAESGPVGDTCLVSGRLSGEYDPARPTLVKEAIVGPGCLVQVREGELTASEYTRVAGTEPARAESLLASGYVRTRLRTEHLQVLMVQLDNYLNWSWSGSQVLGYSNSATPATSGCSWDVTDGPYTWFDTNGLPSTIYSYAWAYFESCYPPDKGWLEPMVWGDYAGGWGYYCDYSITLPLGSSVQCIPTQIY